MENRFGVKDFFLFAFVAVLIVLVVLAMKQFDRQYQEVLLIKNKTNELTSDVVDLRRRIGSGGFVPANRGSTGQGSGAGQPAARDMDVFKYLVKAEARPDFARGDWFVDNFGTKVGKLTPLLATDVYQRWVEYLVIESLAVRDPYTLKYVPRVAWKWDLSEDGLEMVFHLRDDVVFSDGKPLTADDVVFTFDFIRNPAVDASRSRAYLTMLKEVLKVDDYTVKFTFTEPYYLNFDTISGTGILAKHFYSKYAPNDFNQLVGLMFGSGPYRLESPDGWAPGKPIVLIRNERYWGVPATFNRMRFAEIQEESAQMVMYGNREFDSIFCTADMFDKLKADQRIMQFSNAFEYPSPYRGYSYIGWNQARRGSGRPEPTHFADKRVRQAMTMLIDRERLLREVFKGYGKVATGPFAPGNPQADPEIKPWPFDIERAKALLAEAGYRDINGDGVLDGPDGKPFKFTLLYPSGAEIYEKLILFFRDSFARAGIVMEPDRQDWPVLVDRLNKSNFEAVTLGWSSTPESDPYQIFHSDQIKDEGDNRTNYINKDLDVAINKARRTMVTEERMKVWNEVHRIIHEDQPYTFLINRPYLRVMDKRIQNVEPAAVGLNYEYLAGGIMPWYVPTSQQKHQQ
jgi:peptide/nickel transport system substrate-binding protein